MSFGSGIPRFCQSTITVPLAVHAYITSNGTSSYEWTTTAADGSASIDSSITGLATGLAIADPVVVAWNLDELAQFPAGYRTSLAEKIGVELTATPASSLTLPGKTGEAVEPSPHPNVLDTGAKIGIGVGAGMVVCILLGVLLFLYIRRRRNRKHTTVEERSGPETAEMEDHDAVLAKKKWYLGGRWRNEAAAEGPPTQELDSKTVHVVPGPPAELDSREAGPASGCNDERHT
ncbi:hypothetical protein BU23DRAFT_184741 [Bimuria novae-zelandiae CBS 107.79]|uniref:Peptidase A1 domain-containing protein n=1 Tax=Bimuria novae-zelandiae CBS 107.79 TaxID=1447943 RepID=A0A6A5V886_9PLEO|nr:hypothetical protein BU23DRAFT_184741 [Bimuria novae-zelandiae CBS 107.79]